MHVYNIKTPLAKVLQHPIYRTNSNQRKIANDRYLVYLDNPELCHGILTTRHWNRNVYTNQIKTTGQ